MNDNEDIVLYRGEGITLEQMCAALPRVFEMTNSQPIIVSPYPIFSDRNECGKNILILCDPETEGMAVIDYNQLMKMEYMQ